MLRVNPDHADAHTNLGVVYEQQGRTDEAIRAVPGGAAGQPQTIPKRILTWAWSMRGRAAPMRQFSEYPGDAAGQPRSCRCAPTDLGLALRATGPPRRGDSRVPGGAARSTPDYAEAHFYMGLVHAIQGRLVEARREARLALQLGYEPARELMAKSGMTATVSSGELPVLVPGRLRQIVE